MAPINREKSSKTKKESAKMKKESAELRKRISSSTEKILKIKREILDIIEAMLETEISEEWFLKNCVKLCHADYDDVVEERIIGHLCGYPLCSNTISQTLKQKYRISQVTNKIYDITERKSFCSNQCYKASKYLKTQLSPIPLHMRKEETLKVNLLCESNNRGSAGEEVEFHHKISQNEVEKVYVPEETTEHFAKMLNEEIKKCAVSLSDLKIKENVFEKQFVFEDPTAKQNTQDSIHEDNSESDGDDSEDKNLFPSYDNMEVLSDIHMPVPLDRKKSLLISPLKPYTAPSSSVQKLSLDFIFNIFKDWMTEDTLKYFLSEKYVYEVKADHIFEKMTASDAICPKKLSSMKNEYINMCLKIDSLPDDDLSDSAEIDFVNMSGEIGSSSKKIVGAGDETNSKDFKQRSKNKSKKKGKHVTFASNIDAVDIKQQLEVEKCDSDKNKTDSVMNVSAEEVKTLDKEEKSVLVESETTYKEPLPVSSVPDPGFPLVDSVSQNTLRRNVISGKLKSVYVDLLPIIGLHYTHIRSEVKMFVDTLSLTPSNIMFKPKEWKLISLILLRLLTRTVLKNLYDEAQFMKLCRDPILPIKTDPQEIEKIVHDILSPESILTL